MTRSPRRVRLAQEPVEVVAACRSPGGRPRSRRCRSRRRAAARDRTGSSQSVLTPSACEVVELLGQAAEIADAVVVAVEEGAHVHLVDDGVLVPVRAGGQLCTRPCRRGVPIALPESRTRMASAPSAPGNRLATRQDAALQPPTVTASDLTGRWRAFSSSAAARDRAALQRVRSLPRSWRGGLPRDRPVSTSVSHARRRRAAAA